MVPIKKLVDLTEADASWAGSKALRLGSLTRAGFSVPVGLVIGASAYHCFVASTGIQKSIQLMLHRKKFEDMRWEEIWDLSLRVRNLFARTTWPADLRSALEKALEKVNHTRPVAVRSAGLQEDSKSASFAGLHDSFINVKGIPEILDKVLLVWASLWSDRALLYRQELNLDPRRSGIAVIVQRFAVGDASGVAFSRSPINTEELLVEGVWGLNQALVDGTIAPYRWHLDRRDSHIKKMSSAAQNKALRVTGAGARLVDLEDTEKATAPLDTARIHQLFDEVMKVERLFGAPQDVEWTLAEDKLVLLQSRPITTANAEDGTDDKRRWYLNLHRSIDNLKTLRVTIQQEVLPSMEREAAALAAVDLSSLDNTELATEIKRRQSVRDRWIAAYNEHCIPFAHGMRMFGQIYNDFCKPKDPFEFVNLIKSDDLLGARRNSEMHGLSLELAEGRKGVLDTKIFDEKLDDFLTRYGLTAVVGRPQDRGELLALLTRLPRELKRHSPVHELRVGFLDHFSGDERDAMDELLTLARDSYRLRDDDNIYLARIEAQHVAGVREAARRVRASGALASDVGSTALLAKIVLLHEERSRAPMASKETEEMTLASAEFQIRARQLVGQPASPGLAVGRARVIHDTSELLSFREGEVLVCDAIDPNMTFVAPLAAGVVERRGGMLIHGAIIAREYGIPCVTGVPEVTTWIQTGDMITVDGHLGLVTVSTPVA